MAITEILLKLFQSISSELTSRRLKSARDSIGASWKVSSLSNLFTSPVSLSFFLRSNIDVEMLGSRRPGDIDEVWKRMEWRETNPSLPPSLCVGVCMFLFISMRSISEYPLSHNSTAPPPPRPSRGGSDDFSFSIVGLKTLPNIHHSISSFSA